jgi:hypothetical protein
MHVYSASDFAERLNVSSIWVRELARKGRIYPAHKVGKNWVFFDSSTVIRPFERTGRAPQKMILPHEELSMKQMMREMSTTLTTSFESHRSSDVVARSLGNACRGRLRIIRDTARGLLDSPHEIKPSLRKQLQEMAQDCNERLRDADGYVSRNTAKTRVATTPIAVKTAGLPRSPIIGTSPYFAAPKFAEAQLADVRKYRPLTR